MVEQLVHMKVAFPWRPSRLGVLLWCVVALKGVPVVVSHQLCHVFLLLSGKNTVWLWHCLRGGLGAVDENVVYVPRIVGYVASILSLISKAQSIVCM